MKKSKEQHAEILISKIEAARRQIDAAIRMTIANEDEVAIHTVASAGYRILRDLLNKRGKFDVEELLRLGLFAHASELVRGSPSSNLNELFPMGSYLRHY
jgi:hypothetical protein